jgi:TolA-binding protein
VDRLVDREFSAGSLEAGASELLRSVEPFRVAPGAKQRVRIGLVGRRAARRLPPLLRPAITLGALAVAVGAAAAVLGGRLFSANSPATAAPHSVGAPAAAAPARATPPERARPAPLAPPAKASDLGAPATAPTAPLASPTPPAASAPRAATAPTALPREATHDAPPGVSEAALVFDATQALRRDGDPARAARLLDAYFHRFPRGALGEEALAVSIEVAAARGEARARALAQRYLARFPSGHFRATAERVLADP